MSICLYFYLSARRLPQKLLWSVALCLISCGSPPPAVIVEPATTLDAQAWLAWRTNRLAAQCAARPAGQHMPHSWAPETQSPVWVAPHVWTSGFFAGCLWQIYAYTGDSTWRQAARACLPPLAPQAHNQQTHDLGFMLYLSFGPAWTLEGDSSALAIIGQAAQSLASRYDARSGLIRSWEATGRWQQPTIIDNLMNLELLFAASRWLGDTTWHSIAHTHARRSAALHQRTDGSHFHVVDVDPATGTVRARGNRQGLHDRSAWSRGQAWAIYGFAMSYRETGDTLLLGAARRAARYFLTHLPPDGTPYWDFALPSHQGQPRDVSAGAIAAAGLLLLAKQEPDTARAATWQRGAERLLRSLVAPGIRAPDDAPHHFALQHSSGNVARHHEVDVPLIYADYYFTEALLRYCALGGSSSEESP